MTYEIVEKACENKDLTRDGLQKAVRQLDAVDLKGVVAGTLDYSKLGEPPTREVYVQKIDPKAPGGVSVIGQARVSENAKGYELKGS